VILQSRVATGEIAGEERERVRSQDSSRGTTAALWRARAAGKAAPQPQAAPGGKDRQPGDEPVGKWVHAGVVADDIIARVIAEHPANVAVALPAVEELDFANGELPF
jgi:hypothetical protein